MKHLYFIRHGQSQANKKAIWSGQLDSPLSEQGILEARKASKNALADNFKPDLIISSPLIRAYETAKILAEALNYPINKIQVRKGLIERNFGKLEGTSIADTLPDFDQYILLDSIESVEKLVNLQKRVASELENIKSLPSDTILIVGHAAFGRALRRVIAGKPYTQEYVGEFKQIPNAEIIKLI